MRRYSIIALVSLMLLALAEPGPAAERLSVSGSVANIRSGPGSTDKILWQVEQYHPLNVIQRSGDWCWCEDFEGDRGWIHKSLLSAVPTVVVKVNVCNVRAAPGTDAEIRFTVDRGVPFKVLEKKGEWVHVADTDGDTGWIHGPLVW